MGQVRVFRNGLVQIRRVDRDHGSTAVEEQLGGTTRRTADFDADVLGAHFDPPPLQRLGQFQPSPADHFLWRVERRDATRPALGN